jgi:Protein of unknown function (DUF2613)
VGKTISVAVSAVLGAAVAVIAAWAISSTATEAPSKNPANAQIVNYGQR